MGENIKKLKALWDKYQKSNLDKSKGEFQAFINKYPIGIISDLSLNDYTNIKGKEDVGYFTHFIERKTERCGKFRTASSFAYGVYQVNPGNIKDKKEQEKAKGKYKTKSMSDKLVSQDDAIKYYESSVRPMLQNLADFQDIDSTKPLEINYARKVAYMYNPDKLLPIYKKDVIEAIAEFFDIDGVDYKSYKATEIILNKLIKVFEVDKPITFELTQKLAGFLWLNFGKTVALDSKNIIYYGAPGTGKTYTVQNAVKQRILLKGHDENEVAEFTQFHPSFGYEDFIEGLKPFINENGSTALQLKPGIFKKFCKKAMDDLREARASFKEPRDFYFIADEINRAELSSVLGELLLCLEESKRVDFDKDGNLTDGSMCVQTQYSYLNDEDEDAVLTIDGRGKFGVPANLYFIGTMNDIDRSIDSFDLALRRRFVWERMDCDYDVIANDSKFTCIEDINCVKVYIDKCKELNTYISKTLRLGKSYEVGHSYFMDVKVHAGKISNSAMQNLFSKKLKPLIEEYLRGECSQLEVEENIKKAARIFSI